VNTHACFLVLLLALAVTASIPAAGAKSAAWPQYGQNPFVIRLDVPGYTANDSGGSMVAADLTGDGRPDFLVTMTGCIAAYRNDGARLWIASVNLQVGGSSETSGLPGHHGPGVQAGDIDGDGKAEVLFLARDSTLHVLEGKTGRERWQAHLPAPRGAERWEHVVICNLRGKGDRDLLLQATNAEGYRMGRYLAAYDAEGLAAGHFKPLWERDDFIACAHNGARVADLDGDGRDEVLGGNIISPEGRELVRLPVRGHLDSIFVADVRPDLPGLEVVALEEGGGQRVFLYNSREVIWEADCRRQEPQNAAVGDFDPHRPGLEIWCRSRYDEHQKPFVFDAQGKVIAEYEMDQVAPPDWTAKGLETISTLDWTGRLPQMAVAKARHQAGDVAIFDPITGEFRRRFPEKADRLYVADVSGDSREEILVLSGSELHIYHNPDPAPSAGRRHWSEQHYRRSKMTWNYYSP